MKSVPIALAAFGSALLLAVAPAASAQAATGTELTPVSWSP
jgi:hypothetical protein